LLAAAFLNRVSQSIVVGWGVIGDLRALRYCWLYPMRDLMGFLIWIASFTSRTFLWRGEVYRFEDGGKIIPQHRRAVNAAVNRL
jgi:ceramide glucosyltransferase